MNDREVLDRIGRGDERVLDYLYKKYYRMMSKIVLSNNGTEEEAKDVYQEALIAFWQKAASGNLVLTSKISTFIYSICKNQWRKELERKGRLTFEEKDGVQVMNHEEEESARILRQCVEELGDPCRSLLTYYYFDGLSMNEIAKKLGFANTDTAKTKKYKCKKRLDAIVKEKYSRKDFFN